MTDRLLDPVEIEALLFEAFGFDVTEITKEQESLIRLSILVWMFSIVFATEDTLEGSKISFGDMHKWAFEYVLSGRVGDDAQIMENLKERLRKGEEV